MVEGDYYFLVEGGAVNNDIVTKDFTVSDKGSEPLSTIRITMIDSWGNGWNGANLSIMDNSGNALFGPTTIEYGSLRNYTIQLVIGTYEVRVTSGDSPDEISWRIEEKIDGNYFILVEGGAVDNDIVIKYFTVSGEEPEPEPEP